MMSTLFLLQPVANVIRPADCNDDRSEKILSTHKGVNSRLKDVIQKQEQNPGHSAKSAGGRLQLNTHTPYVCGFY